jgi:hypothetical protein
VRSALASTAPSSGTTSKKAREPGSVVAATILLAVLAAVLTRKPSQAALLTTAAVFAGLIASYALVLTTGFPVLHPEPEAVDALALFTKAIEAIGLVLAASLLSRPSLAITTQPKGTLT